MIKQDAPTARRIAIGDFTYRFSICTVANDLVEYQQMVASMVRRGFTTPDCEYLLADNSQGNRFDAFAAYNEFFRQAKGQYLILCHQDVELLKDGRPELEAKLSELDEGDPNWALCGNAGADSSGKVIMRVTNRHGRTWFDANLPAEVISLDENFIIAKASARLALSRDLAGFHFYGLDLCTVARALGWTAYVIDFHLLHKGHGELNRSFYDMKRQLEEKYQRIYRPQIITTTCIDVDVNAGIIPKIIRQSRQTMLRVQRVVQRLWLPIRHPARAVERRN